MVRSAMMGQDNLMQTSGSSYCLIEFSPVELRVLKRRDGEMSWKKY